MGRFVLPTWQIADSNGDPISGARLNFYITGTSTRKDTFSDSALTTTNANPVVADSAGRFGNIFLESGAYRVVLTDADDVSIWDRDPVDGALGSSGAVDEVSANYTVTLADATKVISVSATAAARTVTLPAAASAGDGFAVTIKKSDSSANAVTIDGNGSETIDGAATHVLRGQYDWVTLRCDDSNWLVVSQGEAGLLNSQNTFARTQTWSKGADVASANALTLGADGNYFDITGTTAITSIATVGVGTVVKLHFDGALTLTHHATDLILPGGANITTAAGDEAEFVEYATGDWRCTNYSPASPQATQAAVKAETDENTYIPPDLLHHSPGMAKFWCKFDGTAAGPITPDADYNVVDVTDNGTGDYTVNISTDFSSADWGAFASSNANVTRAVSTDSPGTMHVGTHNLSNAADASQVFAAGFGDK
jgi:hypothetical protein